MRTGAPAGHAGYYHEAALYGSDEELLALAVPFLDEGVAAGEPAVLALGARESDLVLRHLAEPEAVHVAGDQYARPALTIAAYLELLPALLAPGADQVRVIGSVPHPGTGADWPTWLRYEAAVGQALSDIPLWGVCPYDTRITPDDVLVDVEHVHPHLATADGRRHRNGAVDPADYVRGRPATPHPLEAGPATLALDGVTSPALIRRMLWALAAEALLPPDRSDDLVTAASEVVTNAIRHGVAPVDVRAWVGSGTLVCRVHDRGAGPRNPLAGLVPPRRGSEGGYGLWIASLLCDRVEHVVEPDGGFSIRLVVDGLPAQPDGAPQ